MNFPRPAIPRIVLIVILLTVAIVGTGSLVQSRLLPFEVARSGNRIVIANLTPGSTAERNGARSSDIIRSIDGRTPEHLADALWPTQWIQKGDSIHLTLQRSDSVFGVVVCADQRVSLLYLILDRFTAFAFLILGLLVWWRSRGDATVSAFMRINLVIGVAAMLSGFPNSLPPGVGQIFYMVAYLGIRSFIPAALLDFVFRFTSPRSPYARPWLSVCLYGVASVTSLFSMSTAIGAAVISTPAWLFAFDVANRHVYGISLLTAMLITIGRLLRAAWTAKTPWEHKQYRWLLLCLVVGAAPYVFFVKLPSLLGWSPPVSVGIAMAMLLITPVGWGMAVASFRMLRVEWTLSRTIVHLISVGILVYLGASIVLLGTEIARATSWFYLLMLGLGGALLLALAFRTLLERVEWAVDHVYYGDWFDDAKVMHDLELKLSNVPNESDITKILTEDVTASLKVRSSVLLIRPPDIMAHDASDWLVASNQPAVPHHVKWGSLLPTGLRSALPHLADRAEPLSKMGYDVAVALNYRDETLGWLLLGGKVSGAPYSERDYRLLRALSPVAGMALVGMEMKRRILDHERRTVVIDLAGGIAHEIGNALSPLMGQAQMIEHALKQNPDRITRENVAQPLQIIVDMCGRIRRIVQNLSRLAQPVLLEQSSLCLTDVAEDAIQLMTETAGRIKRFQILTTLETVQDREEEIRAEQSASPFKLRKELGKDLPRIKGDAQQLSQVFMNLIINAADAMESDGRGLLTVGTVESFDPPGVIGYVVDTGPGIAQEVIDKIFQPYFTTKPKGQGIGLGLTFVRSIIEAHHGHIRVLPSGDRGTRFEFFLPIISSK